MQDWNVDVTNDPFDDYNLMFEITRKNQIVATIKNTQNGLVLLWYASENSYEIPLVWLQDVFSVAQEKLLFECQESTSKEAVGAYNPNFEKDLKLLLQDNLLKKDGEMTEYILRVFFVSRELLCICNFVDVLNQLLVCEWHKQHENIASTLQQIHDESSVEFLEQAFDLSLEYLEWDDNYAFAVKCLWALGDINTPKAKLVLEKMAGSPIEVISRNAKEQLGRLDSF